MCEVKNIGKRAWLVTAAIMLSVVLPGKTDAQTPFLGDYEAGTVMARGAQVGVYNPAMLAFSEGWAVGLPSVLLGGAVSPIGLGTLEQYGDHLEGEEKAELLQAVRDNEGLSLTGRGTLRWAAVMFAPFSVDVTSSATGHGVLSPGAVEVLLYGNEGQTSSNELDLEGNIALGQVRHELGASYGRRIPVSGIPGELSAGVRVHGGIFQDRMFVEDSLYWSNEPFAVHL